MFPHGGGLKEPTLRTGACEGVFPRSRTAEEHAEQEEQRLGVADRMAMLLARPFTKKSKAVGKLRLQASAAAVQAVRLPTVICAEPALLCALPQLTYIALGDAEARHVMMQQVLPVPNREGSGGPRLHPLALRLLHSGLLSVSVRAEGVLAGRAWGAALLRPYYKIAVSVGGRQAESDASQASRQGVVEFSRPAALHLEPELVQDEGTQGGMRGGWGQKPLCSAAAPGRCKVSKAALHGAPQSCPACAFPLQSPWSSWSTAGWARRAAAGR